MLPDPISSNATGRLWRAGERALVALECLRPVAQLAARLYVGVLFFGFGRAQWRDWDTTLALFRDEYRLPWLNPVLAAWLCVGAELVLPVLLVLGLLGRLAAGGLLVLVGVALVSLVDPSEAVVQAHVFWGSLLLGLLLWGPGGLSVDRFLVPALRARFTRHEHLR